MVAFFLGETRHVTRVSMSRIQARSIDWCTDIDLYDWPLQLLQEPIPHAEWTRLRYRVDRAFRRRRLRANREYYRRTRDRGRQ